MITRLDSISGVIISVLASSVVNHDYKAGSIFQPCNHDLPLEASMLIITPLILLAL
jgi:hypothetical protein